MKRPEITEDMRERLNQALADLWADDGLSDFVELLDAQKLAICEAGQLTALREENEALQERVKELEFDAFDEFDDCDDWSQKLRFSDHFRYRLGDFIHLIKNLHNLRRHKCRNCGNVEWTMHEFSPCFACTVEF